MSLRAIHIPDSIKEIRHSPRAAALIDEAHERIEAFMLADQSVIEDFVTCDFHLLDQSLEWIHENHLLAGRRFCELGSGFGVAAMLAAIRGMESVGIEIQSVLAAQASDLADDLGIDANFFCGSYLPRGVAGVLSMFPELEYVAAEEGDVYEEIGLAMDDFDLFFAFPWPHEHVFFERLFDTCAADGALLLTYRGREGMNLFRKH